MARERPLEIASNAMIASRNKIRIPPRTQSCRSIWPSPGPLGSSGPTVQRWNRRMFRTRPLESLNEISISGADLVPHLATREPGRADLGTRHTIHRLRRTCPCARRAMVERDSKTNSRECVFAVFPRTSSCPRMRAKKSHAPAAPRPRPEAQAWTTMSRTHAAEP